MFYILSKKYVFLVSFAPTFHGCGELNIKSLIKGALYEVITIRIAPCYPALGSMGLVDAKLSQDVQAPSVKTPQHTVKKRVGFMVHIVW